MKINRGLEKQMAKEILTQIINDNEDWVEISYTRYRDYVKQFPRQLDEKIHSAIDNFYAYYKTNNIKGGS